MLSESVEFVPRSAALAKAREFLDSVAAEGQRITEEVIEDFLDSLKMNRQDYKAVERSLHVLYRP